MNFVLIRFILIVIFISTDFDNDNKFDIKDSLSSEIYTYNYRTFYRTLQSETYKTTISDTIIIINKKFDKDKYKIYINGNPYKIFEKKKQHLIFRCFFIK